MKKVLVIGDILIDRYVQVETRRFCQEAPALPVFDAVSDHVVLGGAANVAANIAALGENEIEVHIAGIMRSTDKHLLKDVGIKYSMCAYGDALTKTRFHVDGDLVFRVDNKRRFDEGYIESFDNRMRYEMRHLDEYEAVVLYDYDKGTLDSIAQEIVDECSIPVTIIDSKRRDLSCFCGATYLNINEEEFVIQSSVREYITVEELFDHVIVTMGARGSQMRRFQKGSHGTEYIIHTEDFPTDKVDVIDVTGCGDVHTAAFTVGLVRDRNDPRNAARFANACATFAVQRFGTTRISKWDFLKNYTD